MASHRLKSSLRGVAAIGVLTACLATVTAPSSLADPAAHGPVSAVEPGTPSDAITQILQLSRQAEQTTEALHKAQDDLNARLAQQRDAQAKQASEHKLVEDAEAKVDRYRPTADLVATANYEGARINRLYALLISNSPQQLLDQMSALDQVTSDTKNQLDQYTGAVKLASDAEARAQSAAAAARTAAGQVQAQRATLQAKQSDLQTQIDHIRDLYASMTGGERATLAGSLFPPGWTPAKIVPSSGVPFAALQVALTRIGDPYVWGATGPNQFDCSGLVQWAFKQVGISVPRTSEEQAQYGTPVALDDLQPGDIITFYSDASHVGIYVGDGMILHASTFGVPVKVQSMAAFPIHNARRF
ncbi:NlpC/P60 family protein [Speluncibacter jeojiensis]|uniref:NlpC/P60 family protein n=1 Tax=Speluncibacter jeojiensis TaxID=2710754 RepID=UPI00240EBC71|nr:NlpC/P60 family protein [Rhodococcus sp. D2-41]